MRTISASIAWGIILASASQGATFTPIQEIRSGQWRSVLLQNDSDGTRFCALQSVSETPVFRINSYLNDADTFVELYDPSWSKMVGAVTFSLEIDVAGKGPISVVLAGKSWGDSYTHDILERDAFAALQGLMALGSSMRAKNSNGTILASYSLEGSADALRSFNACLTNPSD